MTKIGPKEAATRALAERQAGRKAPKSPRPARPASAAPLVRKTAPAAAAPKAAKVRRAGNLVQLWLSDADLAALDRRRGSLNRSAYLRSLLAALP